MNILIYYDTSFQDKRINVVDALAHPYLDDGRLRYHSCMCKCCYYSGNGNTNGTNGATGTGGAPGSTPSQPAMRQYTLEFEPVTPTPFTDTWEKKLTSVHQVKGISHDFCFAIVIT